MKTANIDLKNKPQPWRPLNSIKTSPLTKIEIDQAIKEFSRKKSPGPDYALTADVLKDGGKAIREILSSICNIVFKECHVLTQSSFCRTGFNTIQPIDFKSNPINREFELSPRGDKARSYGDTN